MVSKELLKFICRHPDVEISINGSRTCEVSGIFILRVLDPSINRANTYMFKEEDMYSEEFTKYIVGRIERDMYKRRS